MTSSTVFWRIASRPIGVRTDLREEQELHMNTPASVDIDVLRDEIQKTYTDVSEQREQEFIFPTGRTGPKISAIRPTP